MPNKLTANLLGVPIKSNCFFNFIFWAHSHSFTLNPPHIIPLVLIAALTFAIACIFIFALSRYTCKNFQKIIKLYIKSFYNV